MVDQPGEWRASHMTSHMASHMASHSSASITNQRAAAQCGTVHADVAATEAQGVLRGPIQAALKPAQDEDRARTSAAAEVLAGIVASSTTYEAGSGTPCLKCLSCAKGVVSTAMYNVTPSDQCAAHDRWLLSYALD